MAGEDGLRVPALVLTAMVVLAALPPGLALHAPSSDHLLSSVGRRELRLAAYDRNRLVERHVAPASPAVAPAPRTDENLANDPADGYVLLFGGANGSVLFNDTWAFAHGNWTLIHPTGGVAPSPRVDASLTYRFP